MKRIFILTALILFAVSCKQEVTVATNISIDETAVAFDGKSPVARRIQLRADGDWYVYAPDWVKVTPSHGSGNTAVSVEPSANVDSYGDLNAPRADEVAFWSTSQMTVRLAVSQEGEPGLDVSGEYTLLTDTESFDPARGVIIAAWDGSKYNAALPFAATSDTDYGYLSSEVVTPDAEGVIRMNSLRLTWKFVSTDAGLALQGPNWRYLFMSPSYANFYSSTDVAKADMWTVSVASDGLADIIDSNVGKLLQYGPEYTTFGGYASLQSFGVKVSIFIDNKPASKEILSASSPYLVADDATSLTIPVQADSAWTVRCHDDWINSCTATEDAVNLTFGPNTSTTEDRTANVRIIGRTKYIDVTIIQSRQIRDLAALNACIRNGASSFRGALDSAVVSYVNGGSVFLRDAGAGVLLYNKTHGFAAGDVISGGIDGNCTLFNALPELTSLNAGVTGRVESVPCDTLSIEALLKDYDSFLSCPVYIRGITFDKGISAEDKVGSISQNGASIAVKLKGKGFSIDSGRTGDLYCIPEVSGTVKQLGVWEESHFTTEILN